MARQECVLSVFLASPSDVNAERLKLEEVVNEMNTSWSRELGMRLDLVRWESHAYPDFGDDSQDVINNQIPNDYDIFIGIMWCRYGTPTGRSGSGTVEEFTIAKSRFDKDNNSVKLMLYFKDEPVSPSQLDPNQLAKINDFRNTLGEEGALYWNFTDIEHFEKLVRLHLTRQVQAWKTSQKHLSNYNEDKSKGGNLPIKSKEFDDDDGILDLLEVFQNKFQELPEIIKRITAITEDVGIKMAESTAEINALPRDIAGNAN